MSNQQHTPHYTHMNKPIIAGKTILLNVRTNTTFIANDLDVTVGWRDDEILEWAGELDIAVCDHRYKTACEQINPDNPMAVAENLKEMVGHLRVAANALRIGASVNTAKSIETLLTKIQAK